MTVNQLLHIVDRERRRQGYTYEKLSMKAGFQKSLVSRWINASGKPHLTSFIGVLDALGLELRIVRKKEEKV